MSERVRRPAHATSPPPAVARSVSGIWCATSPAAAADHQSAVASSRFFCRLHHVHPTRLLIGCARHGHSSLPGTVCRVSSPSQGLRYLGGPSSNTPRPSSSLQPATFLTRPARLSIDVTATRTSGNPGQARPFPCRPTGRCD